MKIIPTLSIILTTYNRPDALCLVLLALAAQTRLPDETIVADDGSNEKTRKLIEQLRIQLNYPLKHVWQKNRGFRAAKIRNTAALAAQGDYLVFLDGDCVPFPDFIDQHRQLAETGWFVSGHRVLLNEAFTKKVLDQSLSIYHYTNIQWLRHYFLRRTNRLFPLLRFNLKAYRKSHPKRWHGAKSCNFGIWKKDFYSVNGFDESFIGWGYEDSDLVIRLIRSGIFRKSGKFAIPVVHLWHAQNNRHQEKTNLQLLQEVEKSSRLHAKIGIDSIDLFRNSEMESSSRRTTGEDRSLLRVNKDRSQAFNNEID
jgi:glycosyltransferase involved in cell wall biosynthesis